MQLRVFRAEENKSGAVRSYRTLLVGVVQLPKDHPATSRIPKSSQPAVWMRFANSLKSDPNVKIHALEVAAHSFDDLQTGKTITKEVLEKLMKSHNIIHPPRSSPAFGAW